MVLMKANTVEQFHILQWLDKNFIVELLIITFLDNKTVRIDDGVGGTAIVSYEDGQIHFKC